MGVCVRVCVREWRRRERMGVCACMRVYVRACVCVSAREWRRRERMGLCACMRACVCV